MSLPLETRSVRIKLISRNVLTGYDENSHCDTSNMIAYMKI